MAQHTQMTNGLKFSDVDEILKSAGVSAVIQKDKMVRHSHLRALFADQKFTQRFLPYMNSFNQSVQEPKHTPSENVRHPLLQSFAQQYPNLKVSQSAKIILEDLMVKTTPIA